MPVHSLRQKSLRTCVGCRQRADRSALLRVVAAEVDEVWCVVPDPDHRLTGRGASLHPDPVCLGLAERRKAFPRALRRSGMLDVVALREFVGAQKRIATEIDTASESSTSTVRAGSGSEADEHPMSTQQ